MDFKGTEKRALNVGSGAVFLIGIVLILLAGPTTVGSAVNTALTIYLVSWAMYFILAHLPKDEICKRFLLMTGALIFMVVVLELPAWIGLIDYRNVFSTSNVELWNKPGYAFDDELLWVHRPHSRLRGSYTRGNVGEYLCLPPHETRPYDLRYDRNGFRNETDIGNADTVIIGDSYVESQMLASHQLMTTLLSRVRHRQVANLGVVGYGPQQELITLKRYGLPLQPKTVVWVFYEGNDLSGVQTYARRKELLSDSAGPVDRAVRRSFIKNSLDALLRLSRGCSPHTDVKMRYGFVREPDGSIQKTYFLDFPYPLSADDLNALDRTRTVLAEAYELCKERGIRLIVVFAPTKFRVYEGTPALVDVSDAIRSWPVNDLPDRLAAIVDDISPDIDYLDLTPIFKASTSEGHELFLNDDSHWSADGHRLAAETLHSLLEGRSMPAIRQARSAKLKTVVDLNHDALMARGPDGTIRYWSKGAERMYGWKPKETLGKSSHQLLQTIFPKSLQSIEAELNRTGRWEGELLHKRRDGSPVVVASRWELQRNALDNSTTVIEINSERPRTD